MVTISASFETLPIPIPVPERTTLLNYEETVATMINKHWEADGDAWKLDKKSLVKAFIYLHLNKSKNLENSFKTLFVEIDSEKLDEFLQSLVFQCLKQGKNKIHQYALSLISFDKLESILESKGDGFGEELQTVKDLASTVSKYYKEPQGSKAKKSFLLEIKRSFSFVLNFIPNVINTFMIAFSLYDIGKDPQSAWEASALLDVYYKFIMIPAAIVVVLNCILPPLGLGIYGIAAAIVLVLLVALVIYVKWLRPCPNRLPHCTNLTEDSRLGHLAPVVGREDEIGKLVNLFSNLDNNLSRHAILVGPSGVGKTEIVKGLAQKIAEGKDIPKSLRNKKIFVINTASLVQGGMYGYADQLTYLMNRVKGYENEVIFFFDEIQAALKEKSCLSDFLKPILDRGKIHCIAATTTKEYNKYILKDLAFARRFEKVNITEMGDDDVKEVLQTLIRDSKDGALVDDTSLDSIITKTNSIKEKALKENSQSEYQQPAFSVQVLTHAIKKVSTTSDSNSTPPELIAKRSKSNALKISMSRNVHFRPTTPDGKKILAEIQKLDEEIDQDEDALKVKRNEITLFKKLFAELKNKQSNMKKMATVALKKKRKYQVKELKKFYLEYEYIVPQLKKLIDKLKNKINDDHHKINVDDALIDEVLREIQENEKQIVDSHESK